MKRKTMIGDDVRAAATEQPVTYLLYAIRIDGEDQDVGVTVPILASMDPEKMQAFVERSMILEPQLVEKFGNERLAGRSWTITSCQQIDEATRQAFFPDEPTWTATHTEVGKVKRR